MIIAIDLEALEEYKKAIRAEIEARILTNPGLTIPDLHYYSFSAYNSEQENMNKEERSLLIYSTQELIEGYLNTLPANLESMQAVRDLCERVHSKWFTYDSSTCGHLVRGSIFVEKSTFFGTTRYGVYQVSRSGHINNLIDASYDNLKEAQVALKKFLKEEAQA